MFNKKDQQQIADNALNGVINLIGQGTSITGDISCKGDIRIDGEIRGNVISKSKVVLGSTGQIIGDIIGTNADISGHLHGDISVSDTLFLKATAKVEGDIVTNKLIVEAGALFTGNCNMGVVSDVSIKQNAGREKSFKTYEATAE